MRSIVLSALLLGVSMGVSMPAMAAANFSVGLEGFHDRYREPQAGIQVKDSTNYGSVTAQGGYSWQHYFLSLGGRASYGRDHYKSVSGILDDARQYEGEVRLTGGPQAMLAGGLLKAYSGIGTRLFYDQSRDRLTTLGFAGYDRRIAQFYVPLGASWQVATAGGWTVTPTAEYDYFLRGFVNSRIQNAGGYNITNIQESGEGYGLRGELMFGKKFSNYSLEAGPFVRYWNINQSRVTHDPSGTGWIEPKNDRLQAGAAVKLLF